MTFGHEFTGVVEEVGDGVEEPKVGDLGLPGQELPRAPINGSPT
jgi:threonine dehydrogenase-like Zn-dependent dehydrogenase